MAGLNESAKQLCIASRAGRTLNEPSGWFARKNRCGLSTNRALDKFATSLLKADLSKTETRLDIVSLRGSYGARKPFVARPASFGWPLDVRRPVRISHPASARPSYKRISGLHWHLFSRLVVFERGTHRPASPAHPWGRQAGAIKFGLSKKFAQYSCGSTSQRCGLRSSEIPLASAATHKFLRKKRIRPAFTEVGSIMTAPVSGEGLSSCEDQCLPYPPYYFWLTIRDTCHETASSALGRPTRKRKPLICRLPKNSALPTGTRKPAGDCKAGGGPDIVRKPPALRLPHLFERPRKVQNPKSHCRSARCLASEILRYFARKISREGVKCWLYEKRKPDHSRQHSRPPHHPCNPTKLALAAHF